jgi:Protein of unknown function (DUF2004)
MATFDLPVLGPTDFAPSSEGCWDFQLEIPSGPVAVDVNLALGQEMTAEMISRMAPFFAGLASFDSLARAALKADYEKGEAGQAREFLAFHIEEFTEAERERWFGPDDPDSLGVDHLLAALRLDRMGLYPEQPEKIAVFDYVIGRRFRDEDGKFIVDSDEILCVNFDADGKLSHVSWES